MKPMLFCFFILALAGCSEKTPQKTRPEVPIDTPVEPPAPETENTESVTGEGLFTHYDRVRKAVFDWNEAIDKQQTEILETFYADSVRHYQKTLGKKECLASKAQWLKAHPGYRQRLEDLSVYFFEEDTGMILFVAEFNKVCEGSGKGKIVRSLLYFSDVNGSWKIVGETDVPTETAHALKAPASFLKKGDYVFSRSYWQDTRQVSGFAHENVPYRFTLYLHIGDSITGEYLRYSGMLRSTSRYFIPEGKITDDGILEIRAIYNNDEEELSPETYNPEEYPPDHKEQMRFKIVNGQKLIGIRCGIHSDLDGMTLWKEGIFPDM